MLIRISIRILALLLIALFLTSCSQDSSPDPIRAASSDNPIDKNKDYMLKPNWKYYWGRNTHQMMLIELDNNGLCVTNYGNTVYNLYITLDFRRYYFGIVEKDMTTSYMPLPSRIRKPESVSVNFEIKPYIQTDDVIIHTDGISKDSVFIVDEETQEGYVEKELIIKFIDGVSVEKRYEVFRKFRLFPTGFNSSTGTIVVRYFDDRDPQEIIDYLKFEPLFCVEKASQNLIVNTFEYGPNDPVWVEANTIHRWNMRRIQVNRAWDIYNDGIENDVGSGAVEKIILAIVDSGLYLHDDYDYENVDKHMDKIIAGRQRNFVNPYEFASDGYGHGTCVAGIAGAMGDNGIGMAGICWDAHFLPLKVINDYGQGSWESIINATTYIAELADEFPDYKIIVNFSLGGKISNSDTLNIMSNAVQNAFSKPNVLLIAAAGNNGQGNADEIYPAAFDQVISVGASSIYWVDGKCQEVTYEECPYSWGTNWGDTVDVCAPGSSVIYATNYPDNHMFGKSSCVPPPTLTCNGEYCDRFSGTSAAAPHVTGLAALLWSKYPYWTKNQVKQKIINTADPMYLPPYKEGKLGSGRINCYRALTE